MHERIAKYRRVSIEPTENPKEIGSILLAEPFFFRKAEWIPVPSDFSLNIVQGKGYNSEDGTTGKALWGAVTERLAARATENLDPGQRLSQRSRVSATASLWSFDRDSAKAHSE
jgi:hypothetical protein